MKVNHRILGAHPLADGACQFCVWAPTHELLEVVILDSVSGSLPRRVPLKKHYEGYHHGVVSDCNIGTKYSYSIDGGIGRPDPASRFQPEGVHGPSEVVDSRFEWTDHDWPGVDRDDLIIYELHIGTFTRAGTYRAAIDRLDELVDLGITAIELMPLAQCAGRWNWGYDGVNLFAPNHMYGTPEHLREFVDKAHSKGLAVILDVVYNHLGPEGNYLAEFGPYFSKKHQTPWGDAPNFDDPNHGDDVRSYIMSNAVYWIDEFHFDGLRVDAIHCIMDESELHIVSQLSDLVGQWFESSSRKPLLVAESNVYDPQMLIPRAEHGHGFDAQWCDDFLHSVFAVIRPGEQLSNRQYRPGEDLEQTISKGFVYEGTVCKTRERKQPKQRVATQGLVYSIQNHDFIGNHPLASRLHALTSVETQTAAATLLMLSPAIPMLFMGEEYQSQNPFLFFVDFGDQRLRQAVIEGRRREYPQHDWTQGTSPTEPAAFEVSKLETLVRGNQTVWKYYQSLISLRKKLRKSGSLSDDALSTQYNPRISSYTYTYQNDGEVWKVVVRLSCLEDRCLPCQIPIEGDIVLDSIQETYPREHFEANHAKVVRLA